MLIKSDYVGWIPQDVFCDGESLLSILPEQYKLPSMESINPVVGQESCREWLTRNVPFTTNGEHKQYVEFILPLGDGNQVYCNSKIPWPIWLHQLPLRALLVVRQMAVNTEEDPKYGEMLRVLPEWQIAIRELGRDSQQLDWLVKSKPWTIEDHEQHQDPSYWHFVWKAREVLEMLSITPSRETVLFLMSEVLVNAGHPSMNIFPTKAVIVESLFFSPDPLRPHPVYLFWQKRSDAISTDVSDYMEYPESSGKVISRVLGSFTTGFDWRKVGTIVNHHQQWWSKQEISRSPNMDKRQKNGKPKGSVNCDALGDDISSGNYTPKQLESREIEREQEERQVKLSPKDISRIRHRVRSRIKYQKDSQV